MMKEPFENGVGKGEITGNQDFSFSPQCLLPYERQILCLINF